MAELSGHHRDTVRRIFEHPTSHNIEWHDVASVLEAVADVENHSAGKIAVTVGAERMILDVPDGKDVDVDMLVALRRLLTAGGYDRA